MECNLTLIRVYTYRYNLHLGYALIQLPEFLLSMRKRLETNCNKCATSNTTERYGDHTTVIQKDEKDAEQVKITAQIVQEILNNRIDRIERKMQEISFNTHNANTAMSHL